MVRSDIREVGAPGSGGVQPHLEAARAALAVIHAVLRIENIQHIEAAYGVAVAGEVRVGFASALRDAIGDGGTLIEMDRGLFQLLVFDAEVLGDLIGAGAAARGMAWLDRLCAEISAIGFPSTAGPLHIWLSGQWIDEVEDRGAPSVATARSYLGDQAGGVAGWAARYRADMALMAACIDAMDAGAGRGSPRAAQSELQLAWQPVCAAKDPTTVLYREALLRVVTAADVDGSPHDTIQAFERLGFAALLDRYVVGRVIGELERSPDVVLGVNISAQSARWNADWESLCERFAARPGLACRLILEVTETAPIADIGETVRFVSRMRRMGCRIAVDDFGVGYASIRQLLALAPDIVKIDHVFLRRAVASKAGLATLTHMVALARSIAPTVIVEGIEDEADLQLAFGAGAEWQQGYHFGRPTRIRPWRMAGLCEEEAVGDSARGGKVIPLHGAARLRRGWAI